jgi:Lipase (class 3)
VVWFFRATRESFRSRQQQRDPPMPASVLANPSLAYDPLKAAFYGQFVNAAYTMYNNQTSNPTPTPVQLPGNYKFVAWVQMQDFVFSPTAYVFYGMLAQNPSGANDYVLAIRGTSNPTEWWDDFTSMLPWAWDAFGGDVGYGFFRIYKTLRIIYPLKGHSLTEAASAGKTESLEAVGSFADQVAEAVRRHAAESAPAASAEAAAAPMSVTVVGHSLGSALATLYVADNSVKKNVKTPLLCTLASPCVGDYTFATNINNLGIASWRIVNAPDLVPMVPFFPFWHIDTKYEYNSLNSAVWSLECCHSIDTYLHLLNPKLPLLSQCVLPPRLLAATPLRAPALPASMAAALAAPPAPAQKEITVAAPSGTTINITIKVG